MQFYCRIAIVTLTAILLWGALPCKGEATDSAVCAGPYKNKLVSNKELAAVLKAHAVWLRDPDDPEAVKANLCGAKLHRSIPPEVDLRKADLRQANLRRVDLSRAKLSRADLTKAILARANLSGAFLVKTILKEANLNDADLSASRLNYAQMQQALLIRANLEKAILDETNLSNANLRGANVALTLYEPLPNSLPILTYMALAENLSQLTFKLSPNGLVELREAFKKAGIRKQEREITYAINRSRRLKDLGEGKVIESIFKLILFELTCAYGMEPGRPLLILTIHIPIFAILYMLSLTSRGRSGIWVAWPSDRVLQDEGEAKPTRLSSTFYFPNLQTRAAGRWWQRFLRWCCVILIGFHYSLMSAFRIGWQELNIGAWIKLISPREYTLRSTGWVKFVSGVQSLLGGYMVALWVLTYWGRPFE
ncbi:Pentapeptide repeat family protein [Olavius sp. associated proteobacterium Delta 1]|nr:Pentapeptide repeat family protein [Olavius sp. associated proteobacterium Delta 1]